MSPKLSKVKIGLPWGIGEVEFEPNDAQRTAAWKLYVELMTRISIQPLGESEGFLREALSSLHQLFGVTRDILKEAGPDVGAAKNSVGGIAMIVLNNALRPVLSKWHPLLEDWENKRAAGVSQIAHERDWPDGKQLRVQLDALRGELSKYADGLAQIAGVDGA